MDMSWAGKGRGFLWKMRALSSGLFEGCCNFEFQRDKEISFGTPLYYYNVHLGDAMAFDGLSI